MQIHCRSSSRSKHRVTKLNLNAFLWSTKEDILKSSSGFNCYYCCCLLLFIVILSIIKRMTLFFVSSFMLRRSRKTEYEIWIWTLPFQHLSVRSDGPNNNEVVSCGSNRSWHEHHQDNEFDAYKSINANEEFRCKIHLKFSSKFHFFQAAIIMFSSFTLMA